MIGTMTDFNDWITQIVCLRQIENKVYLVVLTITDLYHVIFDESSRHFCTLTTLSMGSPDLTHCLGVTNNDTLLAVITHKEVLIHSWSTASLQKISLIKVPPKECDWAHGKFHGQDLYLWTRFSNIYVYEVKGSEVIQKRIIESSFQSPCYSCILDHFVISALNQDFEVHPILDSSTSTTSLSFPIHTFSFRDLWLSNTQNSQVTCQALSGHQIVRGTKEGYLQLSSFRKLFGTSEVSVLAHEGPIHCLAVMERTLISGGQDCLIRIWSFQLSLIHTFRQHPTPILNLVPIPSTKFSNHVLAVAKDHSISIFSIDTLKMAFYLPNFPCPPTKLWWKEHYVLVHYGRPGSCYAWDTKSGQLERLMHGNTVEMMFSHCDLYIDLEGHSQRNGVFQKTSLSMFTLDASHVFMINLKKLLAEEDDAGLHESLLSALLVYEIEPALDEIATLPSHQITLGIRGVNGNLSLMAPRQQAAFVISPSVTASRLLGLYIVARFIFLKKGQSEDTIQAIFSRFLNKLPTAIGPKFCFPSLAFFAKHWLDTLPELQAGSRHLFLWTLTQMPEPKQAQVRQYWCQHLPSVSRTTTTLSKTMCRATVIMAVMLCELPTTFTLEWTKEISMSLVLLMNEEDSTKSAYRLAAIELLGRGFLTWQPHLNATQLVRSLVNLSIAVSNSVTSFKAKEALLVIGHVQVHLLVQTMVNDLDHAKSASEKMGILKCISFLVMQEPYLLLPSLPRILESVIRNLDPALPATRDLLLQPTTLTLFEILKKYPSVCFHSSHQRLGVGTKEGMIVVWDLKTATKIHVLEGHSHAVDAVAFSSDAKSLVSYSMKENCIKIWQPSSGFMFFMNPSLKSTKSIRHVSNSQNLLSLRLSLQEKTIEILDDLTKNVYNF